MTRPAETYDELRDAARLAWRNSARCIGRLYWHSLHLADGRHLRDPDLIAEACVDHLRWSTNGGKIRPLITVFGSDHDRGGPRIVNDQLIRYAGYVQLDGTVRGDPANVDLTRLARRLGWSGQGSAFDILPLIIDVPGRPLRWYPIPTDAVLEVRISHPEYDWFDRLHLRWHALPAISSMLLDTGRGRYPAAPFSGWYLGTEIGARNLADRSRYDLLPKVAARLGLDTRSDRTLWRDRALVELNRAVLWSFDQAGVKMADHHSESERFLRFLDRVEADGGEVPTDWSWIVPPMAPSQLGVFHRYYREFTATPGFFPQPPPAGLVAPEGVCPVDHHTPAGRT